VNDSSDIQQRVDDFLTISTTPKAAVALFALSLVPAVIPKRFSPFDTRQLKQALDQAARFMDIANQAGGRAALDNVLREAERAAAHVDPELVRYALMVFIVHHPKGNLLRIRPLELRAPDVVLPSKVERPLAAELAFTTGKPLPTESVLNWFREDPKVNEHHEHWHVVYPFGGVPSPDHPQMRHTRDRQGELFLYMHEQMLARYDAERLAVGLPSVQPLNDYTARIPESYDPSPDLFFDLSRDAAFSKRAVGEKMGDYDKPGESGYTPVSQLASWRDAIIHAVDNGKFQDGTVITPHLLGSTIESSIDSKGDLYGDLHNMGHVFLAYINDPADADDDQNDIPGVMIETRTALRDPIFYRWHKHIDDISFRWQEKQKPNDLSDAPPVKMRAALQNKASANQSPDIILCFKDQLPSNSKDTDSVWQAYGEQTFGGANWDKDFSHGPVTTNELHTMMQQRTVTFTEDDQKTVTIDYLYPQEFFYFLRVENTVNQVSNVTVRIFIAPQDAAVVEDRRKWIELDKFKYTLQPKQRAVIFRRAEESSVIRKPAVKTLGPVEIPVVDPQAGAPDPNAPENYCDCGWPYNLLLPRGTRAGMGFRLFVMLTDWHKDQVPSDSACGSMSYCGAKDKYPDVRDMGYPFDRPFAVNKSIAQTIAKRHNIATRDITIKWIDPPTVAQRAH
jgi:hypothetical protein